EVGGCWGGGGGAEGGGWGVEGKTNQPSSLCHSTLFSPSFLDTRPSSLAESYFGNKNSNWKRSCHLAPSSERAMLPKAWIWVFIGSFAISCPSSGSISPNRNSLPTPPPSGAVPTSPAFVAA